MDLINSATRKIPSYFLFRQWHPPQDFLTMKGKIVRGGKATPLQTGIRVPLVANWPGTISPGSITSDLVDASDFYPTFAELAKTGISP